MPALVAAPVPERPDRRWPFLDLGAAEFWPLVLAPFGIVMLTYMFVLGFLGWRGDGGGALITLVQQIALAVPVAWWIRRRTGSFEALGLRRGGWTRRDVGVGIGTGVVTMIASTVVLAITVSIVEAVIGHPYDPGSETPQGVWFWAFAVMAVCLAPICEEVYFRGFVFQGLRRWVRFAYAGLASGLLFAFVHVEPIRLLSLWLAGLIFAGLFERRKTLVASMCAHATLNLIAITLVIRTR
jgi:membrane protease YdiL (CAAX protease family)